MNYDTWLPKVSTSITRDPLWNMQVYRQALFVVDIGWKDVTRLLQDKRTISLSDQLYRALGSIGANVSEGYSYGTKPNRARMYEYSLGSARESRTWYFDGRHVLGDEVAEHRMNLLARIIQQLLVIVPQERGKAMKEPHAEYFVNSAEQIDTLRSIDFDSLPTLESLLTYIPNAYPTQDA